MARSTWSRGACNGLWVEVVSDQGRTFKAATPDAAAELAIMLNQLEEAAAFGWQCYQDRCEGAYVEASVVKKIQVDVHDLLTDMRHYIIHHGVCINECVAWIKLKQMFNVDESYGA